MVEKIEENEKKRVLEEAEEVEGKKKKRNSKETGKLSTTLEHPMTPQSGDERSLIGFESDSGVSDE